MAIMPSGVLNDRLSNLDTVRITIMISSAMIILVTMIIIFIKYYKLSMQQMKELDKKSVRRYARIWLRASFCPV